MTKVAVLGTGPSIQLFEPIGYEYVIGVNDIYKYYPADAIVCLDYPKVFSFDRLKIIERSTPEIFYSQIVAWDTRPDFVKINLQMGYPEKHCDLNTGAYAKSYCSPFVGVQIAWKLHGATEIHLFGVDLVSHPNLNKSMCDIIKRHFDNLFRALKDKNVSVVVHGSGILSP